MSVGGKILFFYLMVMVLLAPAEAWYGPTHEQIADEIYYNLPENISTNLNQEAFQSGSVAPDFVFRDYLFHIYPFSYIKARLHLHQGAFYYQQGDYYQASYNLGVASHYITDSLSAFHRINAYNQKDHNEYEEQALLLKPQVEYIPEGLLISLSRGFIQGEVSWRTWILSRNPEITQRDLDNASSIAYSEIKRSLEGI